MKSQSTKKTTEILNKIAVIEKEVKELKLAILKDLSPHEEKIISLKGIVKGVDISEKDIASAKESLYSNIRI